MIALLLFLSGCSSPREFPTQAAMPSVPPIPAPTIPPPSPPALPQRWTKAVLEASRIDLLITDPETNVVLALEQVAEKTVRVWESRDLGNTWSNMGTVTPLLYRTRQVKPDSVKETGEPLFIWPSLPGSLPLDLKQPFAVLKRGNGIHLFLAEKNEVWRSVLSLPKQ